MRIRICVWLVGLMICGMAVAAQACRRDPGKTPPNKQTPRPGTILDDLKERLVPTFDPAVKEWLGDDRLALVSAPETIVSYRIFPKQRDADEQVAGFPIVQHGPELTAEQRVQFQWLLLDRQSYRQESLKKCLFLPEYAFTLHQGEATLTVLLATDCPQIKFLAADNSLLRDCDPALPKFRQLLEQIFPESADAPGEVTMKTRDMAKISPALEAALAGPALDAVAAPDTVTAYRIFPKKQDSDANLHGYPILEHGAPFTPEQIAAFQALVLADASYRFESLKKCLFLPEYALTVTRGDTAATFLCDVNCGQVKVLVEEQARLLDWQDQGIANLQALLTNVLATP